MENKTQWKIECPEVTIHERADTTQIISGAAKCIEKLHSDLTAALDLLEETMQIIETAEKVIKTDSRYAAAFEGTGLHIRIKKHKEFLTPFKPTT